MKKIVVTLSIFTILVFTTSFVQAADVATPSATGVIDKLKQIEMLKEKIATKVAQLRENEKSGVSGKVKSVGDTTITLTTKTGEKTVSFLEDTIFFKMTDGVKSDPLDYKQAKNLKEGDTLAVLGYFDSSHNTFSAKYVYLSTSPTHLMGKIADIDKANYTITATDTAGNTLVDIETYTKMYTYNTKTGLVRAGFSKFRTSDLVHIFATANPKEENRASALKIIDLTFGNQITSTPSATPSRESSISATPTEK